MSVDVMSLHRIATEMKELRFPDSDVDLVDSAAIELEELHRDKRQHLSQIEATVEATAARYSQQIRDLRARLQSAEAALRDESDRHYHRGDSGERCPSCAHFARFKPAGGP